LFIAWNDKNFKFEYKVMILAAYFFRFVLIRHIYIYVLVGIATRYDLDGPGIKSRWGARFSAPVQTCPGAYPASCTMGTGSFPGVKRPGRGVDHPPPLSTEVKERVELYLYSPSGPSWPVIGRTLPIYVYPLLLVSPPCRGRGACEFQ
jgi:hypothetical protein